MPRKKSITLRILFFLIFIEFLETFVQFCFKKSVLISDHFEIRNPHEFINFCTSIISSPFLWLGLSFVLVIFIIWSTILSKIDLSVAAPACSASFITVPLVSMIFLHEKISTLRWLGIFFILIGVTLVSMSSRQKEKF